MKTFYLSLFLTITFSFVMQAQEGRQAQGECPGNWLTTDGNRLLDSDGNEVILAGVNWFGFETNLSTVHGISDRDFFGLLKQTKELGFNCLRIPWHNGILRDNAKNIYSEFNHWVTDDPYNDSEPPNPWGPFSNLDFMNNEQVLYPLDVLDKLVEWCQENDMKIILDNHSRNPDGFDQEALWYTDSVSHEQWIEDWIFLTNRYKDFDAVIGMDLNNEPHDEATWGTGDPATDWKMAAEECGNAILAVNPNVLIMVEGVEDYIKPDGTHTGYWWGGNLQGARDFPVQLSNPNKLVYSPHEYGPRVHPQTWFFASDFPDNMPGIWEEQFNFLNTSNTSPLFVGELGIQAQGDENEIWFQKFIDFIKEKKLHYTFWSLNPNSGDTGGILANDWITVVQWKMDYLQPILSNPIPNCSTSVLSVNDLSDISFSVYPNPASQVLNFNFKQGTIKSIGIYDVKGRKVDLINDQALTSDSYTYDVSKLATGMYLSKITIANSKETFTKKIIIN